MRPTLHDKIIDINVKFLGPCLDLLQQDFDQKTLWESCMENVKSMENVEMA